MSRKTSAPSRREPGPRTRTREASPDGLERLLEGQDESDSPARRLGHEGEQGLVLRGVLLAAERAARVRRPDADLRERQGQEVGDHPLEPVRVLDRAPDRDAVAVGRRHVGGGSIANWVTIGNAYVPSTTTAASCPAASTSPHP